MPRNLNKLSIKYHHNQTEQKYKHLNKKKNALVTALVILMT